MTREHAALRGGSSLVVVGPAVKHNFRDIIPRPDDPRVIGITERDACQHVEQRLENPRIRAAFDGWMRRYAEPFFGITTDGKRSRAFIDDATMARRPAQWSPRHASFCQR